ncbi:MAG: hypothetical protein GC204_11020 [Chloroflexi bacterium]|nr:hypothetical protein [Chloroflexota bacterium]
MEFELSIFILAAVIIALVADRYYTRHKKRKDARDEKIIPPQYIDQWLRAKQFTPLHTLRYTRLNQTPFYEWIYTSGEIIAETGVVENQNPLFLFTLFEDNSVVETDYPSGKDETTPNYSRHIVAHGLEAAYDYHRQKIREWGRKPVPLLTADDYERFTAMMKATHNRNRGQRDFLLGVGGMSFILVGGILLWIGEGFLPTVIIACVAMLIGFVLMYKATNSPEFERQFAEYIGRFRRTPPANSDKASK